MRLGWQRRLAVILMAVGVAAVMSSCGWRGLNSLPLPGTEGKGAASILVHVEMDDVRNLQPNARVRVADVTVGHVSKIKLHGWHALLTLRVNGNVELPANATAKIGQATLLGALHIELAPPTTEQAQGRLGNGSVIPLAHTGSFPTPEQTLASVALVLNGGGLAHAHDITEALSTAFQGREDDLRSLIEQLEVFSANLQGQTGDVIAASDSLNRLLGKFAAQEPVLARAVKVIPDALKVLNDERVNLVEATDQLGRFSALTGDTVNASKDNLVKELADIGPVLESLANAGPSLTRSLGLISTYPFPTATIEKWQRGDSANLTAIIDLTLSRIDAAIFTGTRFECNLTALELQWGRTVGQFPSPCLNPGRFGQSNPLAIPYRDDQGP
ncbi:MCE family protein [Mycobacterium sp. SMC-19]|uniref:MCE family protein n=1 Tax=Mycobacterium sp. SMC-19 TaxID=3381630 RepID=UPI003877134E